MKITGFSLCSSGAWTVWVSMVWDGDLLARKIALETGGLSFRANADESLAEGRLVGKFYVRIKMLEERLEPALALLEQVLTQTDWGRRDRLRDLILEMKNDYQGALVPRGHVFASTRSAADLSLGGWIGELTGGLSQLDFLVGLADYATTASTRFWSR